MQKKHCFLNKAIFVMSFIFTTYSQFLQACPIIGNNDPVRPSVRRLEISNPQVPSKPHSANPGSTGPNDLRTLMALQNETIDLIYTLTEPIPSGCIYGLEVSNYAGHISNIELHTPWKAILSPDGGVKSEPTAGDNIIKFKLVPAPQFDQDKIITLYASIRAETNHFATPPTPFKFKNLAYKITSITKEPALDSGGVNLVAKLNALPKSVNLTNNAVIDDFHGFFTSNTGTRKPNAEELAFQSKYDRLNGKVIMLNNTPMITAIVQNKRDVYVHLSYKVSQPYEAPNSKQCSYSYLSNIDLCSTATLIDMPD